MTNLQKKVAVGIAVSALLAQVGIAPLRAQAAITITVSGNGTGSNNTANVTQTNTNTVFQTNTSNVTNNVTAEADTGDNDANDNTGGTTSIDTGDATTNVTVNTTANTNVADLGSCGGCPGNLTVDIIGNGSDSDSTVNYTKNNTANVTQNNTANVTNNIDVEAETGDNDANDNTGGDVEVTTGNAASDVVVTNDLNGNDLVIGGGVDAVGGTLTLSIETNGTGSDNVIDIASTNANTVFQNNRATLLNDVEVDADTGDNDANDNTGGDVSVDTGNANAGAVIDNAINFNGADVSGCCVDEGTVDVIGNGSDSDSTVDLTFVDTAAPTQGNIDNTRNLADVEAETGDNDLNDNTDGDVETDTGNSWTDIAITNDSGTNIFFH